MERITQEALSEYLTLPQVARMRGCSRATVHNMVMGGKLPALRVGDLWVVHHVDAEKVVEHKRLGRPKLERGEG